MSPGLKAALGLILFAAWCGGSPIWPPAPRREVR